MEVERTASQVVHTEQDLEKGSEKGSTFEIHNIEWISCGGFTAELGKKQIKEYISTWEVGPSWLYSLKFLEEKDLEFRKQYHYRVQWSTPTPSVPIPRATACVYFVIEVSKIKPQNTPVEVYYLVESNQLQHRPGKIRFREKWLKDVIESKILLQDTVTF
ncbi:A-kinase anchor protein 14 [Scleropages formosus]|uniref:A-kinase anchoring protein 14 n=1 Tax=Scleropages formosus TaxID=113540 RepID=A0A8C9V310_SCLFO|nr:A-kinase anchor protein 14 [Scleropages formosus]